MLNSLVGIIASSGGAVAGGAYESIASATGTGSSGTITFSSIPSTYTALQIRYQFQSVAAGNAFKLYFNNDTATNYTLHRLYGNGATVTAGGSVSQSGIATDSQSSGPSATSPVVGIIDIHNYAVTTQNKTVRCIAGVDKNGSGDINLVSGLWLNTAAVNRIDFILGASSFTTSTTFALYGIKGA
jgi:hypothetical protein